MINDINKFLRLVESGEQKHLAFQNEIIENNKSIIGNLLVYVSFGKSISAQIPWISISRYGNYREDGPIFLYFKSKRKLILSFGVKDGKSNDSKYNFKWSEQILNNYQNIKDFLVKTY